MALTVITHIRNFVGNRWQEYFLIEGSHAYPIFQKKRCIPNICTDVQESKRTNQKITSINPVQVVKTTECELDQIQGIHQVQLSKNFGGSFKEVIRQCFVLFNNTRDLPPRLHVTRVWPSKASSCLLGARFKSLLYAWIFILSWDIEILLDNSCHTFYNRL